MVDKAIKTALEMPDCLATVSEISNPLVVFGISDKITGSDSTVRTTVAGLELLNEGSWNILKDWEVIIKLNPIAHKPRSQALADSKMTDQDIPTLIKEAKNHLQLRIDELNLPYRIPVIESLACLVPGGN